MAAWCTWIKNDHICVKLFVWEGFDIYCSDMLYNLPTSENYWKLIIATHNLLQIHVDGISLKQTKSKLIYSFFHVKQLGFKGSNCKCLPNLAATLFYFM